MPRYQTNTAFQSASLEQAKGVGGRGDLGLRAIGRNPALSLCPNLKGTTFSFFWVFLLFIATAPFVRAADPFAGPGRMIGSQDAVLVVDPGGKTVFSKNADKKLVPASTLKLLTSLAAIHFLGNDFRFETEFYMDADSNLKIKGYGDPLLISEVVDETAKALAGKIGAYNDLILDGSHFSPIRVPGVTPSFQPYNAPVGALCVNFNTVNFKREKGVCKSAEPQTPLLPVALDRIRRSGLSRGRISLSGKNGETLHYAGSLFKYFLDKHGVKSKGKITEGVVDKAEDRLVFTYRSRFSMEEVVPKLLEYSNNFTANQVFATVGAKFAGPPATLEKGIRAVETYMKETLKTECAMIAEGSGISRDNRICAKDMDRILAAFEPHRNLMRRKGNEFYKTGTLDGVSTRAGYIDSGGLHRYCVMMNTRGKSAEKVVGGIIRILKRMHGMRAETF